MSIRTTDPGVRTCCKSQTRKPINISENELSCDLLPSGCSLSDFAI